MKVTCEVKRMDTVINEANTSVCEYVKVVSVPESRDLIEISIKGVSAKVDGEELKIAIENALNDFEPGQPPVATRKPGYYHRSF